MCEWITENRHYRHLRCPSTLCCSSPFSQRWPGTSAPNASAEDIGMPAEVALSDQCFFIRPLWPRQGCAPDLVMYYDHIPGPLGFWQSLTDMSHTLGPHDENSIKRMLLAVIKTWGTGFYQLFNLRHHWRMGNPKEFLGKNLAISARLLFLFLCSFH